MVILNMKKLYLSCLIVLLTFGGIEASEAVSNRLGVGNTEYVFAKTHQVNFSNKDYALMSYLKLTRQKISDISTNSVSIIKDGKKIKITDQSAQYSVRVRKTSIMIIDGNHKKQCYSKSSLIKKFKNQKEDLDSIVTKNNGDNVKESYSETNSASTNSASFQQNQQSNVNQSQGQSETQETQTEQSSQQNTNPNISEEEWWHRMLAAGWDESHDTEAEYAQKAGLTN